MNQSYGGRTQPDYSWVSGTLAKIPEIIAKEEAAKLLNEEAERIGKALKDDVTTSQVRNVFGVVRALQLRWREDTPAGEAQKVYRQVVLLRPKLAYQAKRANKPGFRELEKILGTAIDEIGKASTDAERYQRFRRFVEFFEAILAYHTAAGAKS